MMSVDGGMCWHVNGWRVIRQLFFLFALLASPIALGAQAARESATQESAAQKSYASPEAAITALVGAVKSNSKAKLGAILGSHGSKLISSGDAVADTKGRAAFVKAYTEANKVTFEGDSKAVLVIGKDEWPFPIPLVKSGKTWKFNTAQGEREILNRRIGRNELAAIQVCLAIADAERDYAASHLDSDGVPVYAARIASSEDKKDGLYWPTGEEEPPSPLGPLVAAAAGEGYSAELAPYHGYFYRILTAQGKDAPGGEYAYLVKGKMIGGFAVVAYPARYGASGIKTFTVDHDGTVFEKDLGQDTGAVAAKMETYNPDSTWQQVDLSARK